MRIRTNVVLIGFMGTGKTSVGRILARKLEKEFVRTDDLIADRAGKPISEIFEQNGESRFRELEMEVVQKVSDRKGVVIDCGGGVILNKTNIDRLRKNAIVILLTASPETVLNRVLADSEQRPLLNTKDKLGRIKELLSFREFQYKRSADFEIDTSNLNLDQVVARILEYLENDSA